MPRTAACDDAMSVKSLPVMPRRTSLCSSARSASCLVKYEDKLSLHLCYAVMEGGGWEAEMEVMLEVSGLWLKLNLRLAGRRSLPPLGFVAHPS